MSTFSKYGLDWPAETLPLQIEFNMLRRGGKSAAEPDALPLLDHYMNARSLLWPKRYRHRWTDLLYSEFIRNDITILLGAASTQKTSHASEFALLNYFARPKNTLVILSTINMDKLDTGVFGEVKMLWQQARDRFDFLPGNLLEGKRAIATDSVDEGQTRDLRKGLVGKPCYVGGRYVGLGTLAGVKQDYIIYIADELQWMAEAFLSAWPNLFSNGNVKIIGSGNPRHDPDDQLGIAAEPKEGWSSIGVPEKTTVWDTNFQNGRCVNLVGTDSPNFDFPEDKYPKLIGRRFVARIANDYGQDSAEFYTQVKGVMRIDMADLRVITRQLCREHRALEPAVWKDDQRTKVFGLDPSYGGADRCVGIEAEFGESLEGLIILKIVEVHIFAIAMNVDKKPEDQIADWLRDLLEATKTPVRNAFYDATGKGTLGYAFARKFGTDQPVAIDSGGSTTNRIVREGLFVEDKKTMMPRPKLCSEHYAKFVSEMWFSCRYAIEANQIRDLPSEVMVEGCARKYEMVAGNKYQVEPKSDPKKKEDLKRRLGKSPDLFDAFAISVEGARQRGFVIASLGSANESPDDVDWYRKESREYEEAIKTQLLDHSA